MRRRLIVHPIVGAALLGLLAGLGSLTLWLSPRVTSWEPPATRISALSPIIAHFNVPLAPADTAALAERLVIRPGVSGKVVAGGRQLRFTPTTTLEYGQLYTVTVKAGLRGRNGLPMLRDATWRFQVGWPSLLFLLERDGQNNVWIANTSGPANDTAVAEARQLTGEPYGIWDYSPLPDGQGVLVSSINADGSMDLVRVDLDGKRQVLVACPDAICLDAHWQPGGSLVAYVWQALEPAGSPAEVQLLDTVTGATKPAHDPAILSGPGTGVGFDPVSGDSPRWSYDGRFLSYFKPDARVIIVRDMAAGTTETHPATLIPANVEIMGDWSPAGYRLVYTELTFGSTGPHEHVDESGQDVSHTSDRLYSHTVVTGLEKASAIDLAAGLEVDDGRPAWQPGGETIATGRTLTGAGRQIWLIPANGQAAVAMTADPFATYSSLAWSPEGSLLAFMRSSHTGGASEAAVWLLDVTTGDMAMIQDGAYLPKWLP